MSFVKILFSRSQLNTAKTKKGGENDASNFAPEGQCRTAFYKALDETPGGKQLAADAEQAMKSQDVTKIARAGERGHPPGGGAQRAPREQGRVQRGVHRGMGRSVRLGGGQRVAQTLQRDL